MAMKDSVCPFGTVGLSGLIMIISRTTGVTVSTVEPLTPSSVALIVEVPVARADAMPPLVMVATEVVADAHVT